MSIILFLLFVACGFLVAEHLLGKGTAKRGVLTTINNEGYGVTIYIRAWICALLLFFILVGSGMYSGFLFALIFGVILQGLQYKDFYVVFSKHSKQIHAPTLHSQNTHHEV